MVYQLIQSVRTALKYRGGLYGLIEHMYTNGDYPFKFGTFMGSDAAGNRYYENRVDYPFGQHRWVEPGDIYNYDSSQVPPEWHGWLHHINDATPSLEDEYIQEKMKYVKKAEISHAPYVSNIGHQEPYFNWHHMHNQSQVRSRGYNIGNHVVGLPPGAPDAYYTQPGSPYNDASIRTFPMMGDLDQEMKSQENSKSGTSTTSSKGRPYKNLLWKKRFMTTMEQNAEKVQEQQYWKQLADSSTTKKRLSPREMAILERGGTLSSSSLNEKKET